MILRDISPDTPLILRCSENTPAQLALFFAVESEENELFNGRWGRPLRLNLFNVLVSDLGKRNLSIETVDELYEIRNIAECEVLYNLYGYRLQYICLAIFIV